MGHPALRFTLLCGGIAALAQAAAARADEPASRISPLETSTVEVIGETPLPGLGVPRDEVPSNVQAIDAAEIRERQTRNLPDLFDEALPSVNVNQITGNPFQADVDYRGFTASPLVGTPQGLSVYLDGMRLNEPFGAVVYWDLIPQNVLSAINVLPGSNPVFGLNTLGGAISMRSKSGETHPGLSAQIGGGSFGRTQVAGEYGGSRGPWGWYVAGNGYWDQGWRDFSPSRIGQGFAKVGYQTANSDLDFSILGADNFLTGNQLTPNSMLQGSWESVYTHPDETRNRALAFNLTGNRELSGSLWIGGNLYRRTTHTRSSNPDVNQIEDPRFGVEPYEDDPVPQRAASLNSSDLDQTATGLTLQGNWQPNEANTLTAGMSFEWSDAAFLRSYRLGDFTANRGVAPLSPAVQNVDLDGTTRSESLFLLYRWRFLPAWLLTASARYDQTHVKTQDNLEPPIPDTAGLHNDFTYRKLNPAVGLNFQPDKALTVYGGFSQGSRAPSPVELACADPQSPCLLPNAMQADPFLDQVVTRTIEAGARGRLGAAANWSLAAYRANNTDDILFISAGNSRGYFQNFGKTRRQGIEASLNGTVANFEWSANYSLIDATFESSAVIVSPNNSTRGTVPGLAGDEILVSPGNRLPGIPRQQLKLWGGWRVTPELLLGAGLVAFSGQYVRGNENNLHQPGTYTNLEDETNTFYGSGKAAGYTVVNLTAQWNLAPGWQLLGKVANLFDKRYSTAGQLGENAFPGGSFQPDPELWWKETFYAPGAPRAFWIGIQLSDAR